MAARLSVDGNRQAPADFVATSPWDPAHNPGWPRLADGGRIRPKAPVFDATGLLKDGQTSAARVGRQRTGSAGPLYIRTSRNENSRRLPAPLLTDSSPPRPCGIFLAVRDKPLWGPLPESETERLRRYPWRRGGNAVVCQQAFRDADRAFANWLSSGRRAGCLPLCVWSRSKASRFVRRGRAEP
ncbi:MULTISPECIES: hypothetical protein [unclassified Streptomyces]|uniref:hypothetical protein n=1 Tax=unclassified Streptomyces TaxID=2593676 RepID=UPI002E113CF1|nr:transposase [Streptomyces sp. NBC_01197]WSS53301.1 transposase [Streptomyces sp. NBC_01180]